MNQGTLFEQESTLYLTELDLYNWGGFNSRHRAKIDAAGTAVIGPTGSGKTTLIDALMTLICVSPRYNLASTGGHESDRDLVSYVRGVCGPGDGGSDQSHISRASNTLTAIAATFSDGAHQVRIGALLSFDGTSSSASDMKKLWLFTQDPEQTLDHWLTCHHEGGVRALKKMAKEGTGIWVYPSKKRYLSKLRDYFAVGENAFALLNRAAGLKQLNSIDEIFRELVLDDRAAFNRAQELAGSFDDLTDIHSELEIARKQRDSLLPVKDHNLRYRVEQEQLDQQQALKQILPIWFGQQAHQLWQQHQTDLEQHLNQAATKEDALIAQLEQQKQQVDSYREAFLNVGGGDITQLEQLIKAQRQIRKNRAQTAKQYLAVVRQLQLDEALSEQALRANQSTVRERLSREQQRQEEQEERYLEANRQLRQSKDELEQLQAERKEVAANPDSNIPPQFGRFRAALAEQLELTEEQLPFVAELLQVKEEEHHWRGAIERAIGSHRLRILVPPEQIKTALHWVNQRDNRLHVRLLEVKKTERPAQFFADGFTSKVKFKTHPYRETVKQLLAGIDRHCVENPEALRATPHAMTAQGMMSGKARHFDKQDQKRLNQDWMTGFDNRDRLAALEEAIQAQQRHWQQLNNSCNHHKQLCKATADLIILIEGLNGIQFEQIDLPGVEGQLENLQQQLALRNDPNSDIGRAKQAFEQAKEHQQQLEQRKEQATTERLNLSNEHKQAGTQKERAKQRCQTGLTEEQRTLATSHLPTVDSGQLMALDEVERRTQNQLQEQIDRQKNQLGDTEKMLVRTMANAKSADRGALTEVGTELEDIPAYLERLQLLQEEALPEKLSRFISYLNSTSDQGVTQLLSHIDNEVSVIEERLEDLNQTLHRVDFEPGRYLRLVANKVVHESLRTLKKAQRRLNSARYEDDNGESHYQALQHLVALLRDACERQRTQGAKALLDPRYRLEFSVAVIDREQDRVIATRTSSQGGSGGEKEIIASYVLTASLSYALCPDGSNRPLFGTIVLDEAFSRSSNAVAGRIIAALDEFGLHAVFITPNKEMRLLRNHTRSAIVVHRRGQHSTLTSLRWEALDQIQQQRGQTQR